MAAHSPIAALLVDLDGTLVDTLPALRCAYAAFLTSREKVPTDAEFDALNGPSLTEIVDTLTARHGLTGERAALLGEYEAHITAAYAEAAEPMPGAETLLETARRTGARTALVTSAPRAAVESLLARFGWIDRFDAVVCGNDVERGKPAPDLYIRALDVLGMAPEQALAVEDSDNGLAAAAAAGIAVLRAMPGDNFRTIESTLNAGVASAET